MAHFFLWLHASQVYARGATTIPISRSLAIDDPLCYPDTKSVKIETANKELLNILEVKAVSLDDVNVALSGTASQSTTYMAGMARLASYAIDGICTY
jgi:hypothetical protein